MEGNNKLGMSNNTASSSLKQSSKLQIWSFDCAKKEDTTYPYPQQRET